MACYGGWQSLITHQVLWGKQPRVRFQSSCETLGKWLNLDQIFIHSPEKRGNNTYGSELVGGERPGKEQVPPNVSGSKQTAT